MLVSGRGRRCHHKLLLVDSRRWHATIHLLKKVSMFFLASAIIRDFMDGARILVLRDEQLLLRLLLVASLLLLVVVLLLAAKLG